MKSYESRADIEASPETIWSILVDGPHYAEWENGVVRVDGTIALGNKITIVSAANPTRSFPVEVTAFEPGRRMVWSGGMPLGLFRGVRTYSLAPQQDGLTAFHMREEYTGPMLPLIWKTMPDLQPSFDEFAAGLKRRAERGA